MSPPGPGPRLVVLALVLFALGHATWTAWDESLTTDEPLHLSWSRRLLETGSTARLYDGDDSKTPGPMLNVLAQMTAERFDAAPQLLRFAPRLPNLLYLAGLLLVTWLLAGSIGGPWAALLATGAIALDPNLVAHGSIATVDGPYAFASTLTLALAIFLARRPRSLTAAGLGLATAFAFSYKFSAWQLLLALAMLPWAAPLEATRAERRRLLWCLGLALGVAYTALCASYLFDGMFVPLRSLAFKSPPFQALGRWFPELPTPVPSAVLTGLDWTLHREKTGVWNSYVLGRVYPKGVWFYFPLHWALKTPLLLLVAHVVGLGLLARTRSLLREPPIRFLALNLVLTLGYFCLLFRTQVGYRFVLMCIPLASILAAVGLARGARIRTVWLGLVVAVALAENVAYLGNPLAFTSLALQPKREAFRLIADSNLDWQQNRDRIGRYLKAHQIKTILEPVHVLPGHNTFRVHSLTGLVHEREHGWLRRNLDPTEHYLHTYLAYDVSREQFGRYLDANRSYPATANGAEQCRAGLATADTLDRAGLPFAVAEAPARATSWLACVEAPRQAELIFKARSGTIAVGHYAEDGSCDVLEVEGRQEVWFRLQPGVHALCVREPEMKRKWLPYSFEGRWLSLGIVRLGLTTGPRPPEPEAASPGS